MSDSPDFATAGAPSRLTWLTSAYRPVKNLLATVPRLSVWTIFVSVLVGATLLALPSAVIDPLVCENGVVETLSALLYFLALAVAARQIRRQFGPQPPHCGTGLKPVPPWSGSPSLGLVWISGAAVLLWLVLRELDLQKAFTYRSIESVGFYTRAIAPWWQKVLAIALLIPFVVALLHLFWLAARNLLPAVAQRRPWLGHCVAIAFLALITVLCEKALESTVLEEVCELGLAFLVFLFTLDASSWKSTPDVLPAPNPLA